MRGAGRSTPGGGRCPTATEPASSRRTRWRSARRGSRSAAPARRRGESDRIEIGDTTALDVVAGAESLHVKGRYTERIGRSASTRASRLKTTVNGRLKVSGRAQTTLLGGAMADSQAGAVLVAAGMTDDLAVGGGARATAPVDIWLAGVIAMEEKVGTAAADGVLMECYHTLFEREYGPGTHVAGTAVFSGALHVTVKAGFRPMMKVLRGVRNLTPGGGGGGGGGSAPPPPTPPPVPPGEGATGLLGTFRGASGAEDAGDLPRLSDSLAHTGDLANATGTVGARDAGAASRLEDLRSLRRAAEQDDTEAAAIVRRLHGDDAGVSQRTTHVDSSARYDLSMDTDGRYMLVEDPEGPYQLAQGSDGSRRAVQDRQAGFTASTDLGGYDIEVGSDGRYRLVEPDASDSEPAHWRHGVGSGERADDPGYSPIAADAPRRLDDPADPGHPRSLGDDRAGSPPGARPTDRPTDPGPAGTRDLHLEPAPLDGPGADSRGGPVATIETVGQRSRAVPAEGGDLTRHPIGPSSGADEASRGRIHAAVIQDPAANQEIAKPLVAPGEESSSPVLLDIEVEQIDLEHVDDARDLPSPGRLSGNAGEEAGPGMRLDDRGAGWEDPDLPPSRPDAPHDAHDAPGHGNHPPSDILHGLPEDHPSRTSEPPAASHFYGDDELVAAPPPASTPAGRGAGRRLAANVDTAGAIKRLEQEIALQTEEIRRVREGGGSADDLRRLEAEREARRLALSELRAGRDPRPALRTQAADAGEAYRAQALTDLVDYFGGAGQFSPEGTTPGAFGGRVPARVDTSALIEDWRERVAAFSEAADALNPRTAAEIGHAEALSDTESWMRQAVVMMANRQDPSDELLRHAVELEARVFADGTTGAGEASMLRAMAREYRNLIEELLAGLPVGPLHLDEIETPHGGSLRSLDLDAGIGRPGQDVQVENTGIGSAEDAGAGAVESGEGAAALENARQDLDDDIHDAFHELSPRSDTPIADRERHLTLEDYWGMPRGLSPPDPGSSDDVANIATEPVRVPSHGERGESTSDPHHVLDGMEAAFDDGARAPPSSSPRPGSERYRIATEHLDEVLDIGEDTGGATPAPTAKARDRKVRWGDATTASVDIGEMPAAVESGRRAGSRIDFADKRGPGRVGDVRIRPAMELGWEATNPLAQDRTLHALSPGGGTGAERTP